MRQLIGTLVAVLALVAIPAGATSSKLVPAHSHWDGTNNDYELKFCFKARAAAPELGRCSVTSRSAHRTRRIICSST